ncbi:MAG: ATP-binding protein [Clostridiales bacterium]|nr:ATP-binding protein [Clostridiales bacterium]
MALNRCPCGFYPDRRKCHCMPNQIKRYLSKISQPILDRIDLLVDIPAINYDEILSKTKPESSACIRQRVIRARKLQNERYKDLNINYNSRLSSKEAEEYCVLTPSSKEIIKDFFCNKDLSARSYYRILKTARTIADLEGMEQILDRHVNEALMFRIDSLEVK